ncbi:magnesium chelatase subunit D family protein [Inediibacterium massiliense]|uniref:magnesium chelatase subunit D family protein n=1 Tax=Inediibacterium massiliense TaxID=1658111 RepID=UPI0006B65812|nr:magnesium chelatase subunit D family protein [Inediibacterium massiliense]
MNKRTYPFTAIVGMEEVKKALILNMIHPQIGGVLLAGEKGTAKSTIVRALGQLMGNKKVITLPLGTTEDRLIGSINMKDAMTKGVKNFESGILAKAHNNILYVDEVNLLSETLTNTILDVASSKINKVEREGISYSHPCEFILIGTMNPEEGNLKPQLLDRFGLYVEVKGEKDKENRVEIIKRRLEYEKNPNIFYDQFLKSERILKNHIVNAQKKLKDICISNEILKKIARINIEGNTAGHRGDLAVSMAAFAHAAYCNKDQVEFEDVKEVISMSLEHRLRTPPKKKKEDRDDLNNQNSKSHSENYDHNLKNDKDRPIDWGKDLSSDEDECECNPSSIEKEFHIGHVFDASGIMKSIQDGKTRKNGSGRRSKTKISSHIGRYIGYKIPKGKINDIALDATLRAAAPYQKLREKNGMAFIIKKEDIREKIREQRVGNTILFLVDASGSMGIEKRMVESKAAILSLLKDAYQKRDTVGMMTFRGEEASVILPPTRSVELAYKYLKDIKVGGKTPLSLGLTKSVEYINHLKVKNREIMPMIVILSDGRGNVSMKGKDPLQEILDIAKKFKNEKIKFIVVDTETGFLRLGLAKRLSDTLLGDYFKLDDISHKGLEQVIRSSSIIGY